MQFVVVAYDHKDENALERRMAVREKHLSDAFKYYDEGKWLSAAGLLDDNGKMIGSMIVCEYESREQLEIEWLEHEPYVLNNVWDTINIHPAKVAPFEQK